MIDLNSHEMQARFKKNKRMASVSIALMLIAAIALAVLAVWAATKLRYIPFDWTQLVFILLLAIICAYFVVMLVWQIVMQLPCNRILYKYVQENMCAQPEFLSHAKACVERMGEAKFSLLLAGDKLAIFCEGFDGAVQIDLAPIKEYAAMCSGTVNKTAKFLKAYCGNAAKETGSCKVVITNSVGKERAPKAYDLFKDGAPVKALQLNYYFKNNLV